MQDVNTPTYPGFHVSARTVLTYVWVILKSVGVRYPTPCWHSPQPPDGDAGSSWSRPSCSASQPPPLTPAHAWLVEFEKNMRKINVEICFSNHQKHDLFDKHVRTIFLHCTSFLSSSRKKLLNKSVIN